MAHVTDDDIAAFPSGGFPGFGMTEPWAPLAGIEVTEDAYLVELELPGVDKDQTRSGRRNTPGRSVGKPVASARSTAARLCRRTPTRAGLSASRSPAERDDGRAGAGRGGLPGWPVPCGRPSRVARWIQHHSEERAAS